MVRGAAGPAAEPMKRVVVIGSSCSGKTTLARRLAEALGCEHIELDALYWGPGWSEAPREAFRAAVEERLAGDRWVMDGNYSVVRDVVWSRATDAIWLNYPFPIVLGRALVRTLRRIVLREELFGGNRESFRRAFLSRGSILWWVMKQLCRGSSRSRAVSPWLSIPDDGIQDHKELPHTGH